MSEKDKSLQDNAEDVRKALMHVLKIAKNDEISTPFNSDIPESVMGNVVRPSSKKPEDKKLEAIVTDTFFDQLFLDGEGKPINGIPKVSNTILTGLPSSGKSLLIDELLIKLGLHNKVVFVTSEDMWTSTSGRYDLESRIIDKAKKLGFDWEKIYTNIFVLDTIEHTELREWDNFITTYRRLVEGEQATILLVDSMTLLEDNRMNLKGRVLELMRYNQRKGVTSILINQRAVEEVDNYAMAGGIAMSHLVDIVMVMDYKKITPWDGQIKDDTGADKNEVVNFFRVLKCRLCMIDGKYKRYEITNDGLIKLVEKKSEDS